MKMFFLALWALVSGGPMVQEVAAQEPKVNLAQYVRFTISDPEFGEGVPAIDSLFIDDSTGAAYAGHLGILADPCESGWRCLDLGFFSFAIPIECDRIGPNGSWVYGDLEFKSVGVVNEMEHVSEEIKYVIEVTGKRGSNEGVAVYSVKRGLESFATTEGTGRRKLLLHYYLSSAQGALAGGCATLRGAAKDE